MVKNKEGEEIIYNIEILDRKVKITLVKPWESYVQEHSHKWFPKWEKRKAVKKYKTLKKDLGVILNKIKELSNKNFVGNKFVYEISLEFKNLTEKSL